MCYYSTTMRNTRPAREQEDLHTDAHLSHTVLKSSKGEVVCVRSNTQIHIEKLEVQRDHLSHEILAAIRPHLGKPFHAEFVQYSGNGYAADAIRIPGSRYMIHIAWLKHGTKAYVGPKKASVTLEAKLGVDEQTMKGAALDHRTDEAPLLTRAINRVLGLCSIQP